MLRTLYCRFNRGEIIKQKLNILLFLLWIFPCVTVGKNSLSSLETIKISEGLESEYSHSKTILRFTEQDAKKYHQISDVLKQVAGVQVVQQGGVGQAASVFIRGARSESTLVLIDGSEANDAISPAGGFDFSLIPFENIDRVEILKGPQSVLYGSGALGGVVNIITKSGSEKTQHAYLIEAGSYNTHRELVSSSGMIKNLSYSLSGSNFFTHGFSAAHSKDRVLEADGSRSQSAAVKFGWSPNDTFNLSSSLRFLNSEADLDSQGGASGDDPNYFSQTEQVSGSLKGQKSFLENHLKTELGFYYSETKRYSKNIPDNLNPTNSKDHYKGQNFKLLFKGDYYFLNFHSITTNLSYRHEEGLSNSDFNGLKTFFDKKYQYLLGSSLGYVFDNEVLFYDLGFRLDQASNKSSIVSYKATLGKKIDAMDSRIFITYGTGYKLPSLYQLYSEYGDRSLKQESSDTTEISFEGKILNQNNLGITFFRNNFNNLIDFNNTTMTYFNVNKARSEGFEVSLSSAVTTNLILKSSYTYQESQDLNTQEPLIRRPLNSFNLELNHDFEKINTYLQYSFTDRRKDIDPNSFQRMELSSYDLWHGGFSYEFKDDLKAHLKIENILNKKYEHIAGYGAAERSFYLGVSGFLN